MRLAGIFLFLVLIGGCGGGGGGGGDSSTSTSSESANVEPLPPPAVPPPVEPLPVEPPPGGGFALDAQFASFLGGTFFERAQSVHVDAAGFIYVGGTTKSADFPVKPNAYDTSKSPPSGTGNDTADGYVAKLSPDGSTVIWASLIGGSARDQVYAVRTDSAGNVYLVGATGSSDFPTTPGAYDETFNGPVVVNGLPDIFVASLSNDGTTLRFSTFVGGAQGAEENPRGAVEIDEARNRIYVAGTTAATDFPTTPGAFQTGFGGGSGDAFVFALSMDGRNLVAATYLGGIGSEMASTEIEPHPAGDSFYVAGGTNSPNFPVTADAYQRTLADGNPADPFWASGDAFLVRISADLSTVQYATFYGGSSADAVSHNQGVAVDSQGRAVLIGHTESTDLPLPAGANVFDSSLGGSSDGFVAIFTPQGALAHATYLGGSDSEEVAGAFTGPQDRVYLTGGTRSDDFPVTAGAYQTAFGNTASGGNMSDAFLTVFDSSLETAEYSTFLGGSGTMAWSERGRSIWVTSTGRTVVGGVTDSADFPLVSPSVQPQIGGDLDAFFIGFDPQP